VHNRMRPGPMDVAVCNNLARHMNLHILHHIRSTHVVLAVTCSSSPAIMRS
jgi:hypothetical protein